MNTFEEMADELDKFLNGDILKQISEDAPGLVHLFKNVGSAIAERLHKINIDKPSTLDELLADFEENKEKYRKEWKPSVNLRIIQFGNDAFLHMIETYLKDDAATIFHLKNLKLHLKHTIDHVEARKAIDFLGQNLVGFGFDTSEINFWGSP